MQINPLLFGVVNYLQNKVLQLLKILETSFFDASFRKFRHIRLKNHAFKEKEPKCTKLLSFPTIVTFLRPRASDISRSFWATTKRCALELCF